MGWKTLKERFGITHIVQVRNGKICIGSGYVHDLATVDGETGGVSENPTFGGFLGREYPALRDASSDEVLLAVNAKDEFVSAEVVYTYDGGKILEKRCEQLGWPNVTHDGMLMYENNFSAEKDVVVEWAKRNATHGVSFARRALAEAEKDLLDRQADLARCEAELAEIQAAYPEIQAVS